MLWSRNNAWPSSPVRPARRQGFPASAAFSMIANLIVTIFLQDSAGVVERVQVGPSRDPVPSGNPHDGNMGPAGGLPVAAAAWRRTAGSLKRRGDLAIGGTFGAHPPNTVDNGRVEPGDTPCGRRSRLFPVLRAPGPPSCHAIPPACGHARPDILVQPCNQVKKTV